VRVAGWERQREESKVEKKVAAMVSMWVDEKEIVSAGWKVGETADSMEADELGAKWAA
jgi:hypothetical protein